jgi:hypothetical protein
MPEPDLSVPWDEDLPPDWVNTVAGWSWRDWTEEDTKLGWLKWGPCPRCGHTIAVYQHALRTMSATRGVAARCNCTSDHVGRPDTFRDGCGPGSGATTVTIPSAGRRPS